MKNVKMLAYPGKAVVLEKVSDTKTVVELCEIANQQCPLQEYDWVELAKSKQVRVHGRITSNRQEDDESIYNTIPEDGNLVMILTKVAGNEVGDHVLFLTINGDEYGLEAPSEVGSVLTDVAGFDLSDVDFVTINDEEVELSRFVAQGDQIVVGLKSWAEAQDEGVTSHTLLQPVEAYITQLERKLVDAEQANDEWGERVVNLTQLLSEVQDIAMSDLKNKKKIEGILDLLDCDC